MPEIEMQITDLRAGVGSGRAYPAKRTRKKGVGGSRADPAKQTRKKEDCPLFQTLF